MTTNKRKEIAAAAAPFQNLGRAIIEARKAKGLTQEQAGKLVGVTQLTWYHWESLISSPSLRRLSAIAELLDTSPADLLRCKRHSRTTSALKDADLLIAVERWCQQKSTDATTPSMIYGWAIAEARKAKGLTPKQAAKAICVKQGAWRNWEREDLSPSLRHLSAIAELLDTSPADLLRCKRHARIRDISQARNAELLNTVEEWCSATGGRFTSGFKAIIAGEMRAEDIE